jgi:pyruvate carboxylase
MLDFLSYKMYPEVFKSFYHHRCEYGEISYLPTSAFFYGLQQDEEISVEIGQGKVIIIRLLYISNAGEDGMCTVTFDLNGQTRTVRVRDNSVVAKTQVNTKASNDHEVGAPLQGKLSDVIASEGDQLAKGDPLFVIEAMKMETTVTAPFDGVIKKIHLQAGELVQQDDLIIEFK